MGSPLEAFGAPWQGWMHLKEHFLTKEMAAIRKTKEGRVPVITAGALQHLVVALSIWEAKNSVKEKQKKVPHAGWYLINVIFDYSWRIFEQNT